MRKKNAAVTSGSSPPSPGITREAWTIKDFCERNGGICRATWYSMIRAGTAPRFFRVGSRVLISAEAAQAWRAEREAAQLDSGRAARGGK
jgi:predicted DNA-binding transcriptional regulator AlpA